VGNEYWAKHSSLLDNELEIVLSSNVVPLRTASESYQSSFDQFDLPSDDEEYLTPNNVPKATPGLSDRAAL
jgi:hypothetical protein